MQGLVTLACWNEGGHSNTHEEKKWNMTEGNMGNGSHLQGHKTGVSLFLSQGMQLRFLFSVSFLFKVSAAVH
jgi:hypothetical protein